MDRVRVAGARVLDKAMNGHRLGELRHRMCATARAIADTEDRMAGTLERLAVTRPREAVRLRACAAEAREFADVERRKAAEFEIPQQSRLPTTGEPVSEA